MTGTMQGADDPDGVPGTLAELRDRHRRAVQVAEEWPCTETWARVEEARQALTNSPEWQYAQAALNQRVMAHRGVQRNTPHANRW